jgi:hypothetical protein
MCDGCGVVEALVDGVVVLAVTVYVVCAMTTITTTRRWRMTDGK